MEDWSGSHFAQPTEVVKEIELIVGQRMITVMALSGDRLIDLTNRLGLGHHGFRYSVPSGSLDQETLAQTVVPNRITVDAWGRAGAKVHIKEPLDPTDLPDEAARIEFEKTVFAIILRDINQKPYDAAHFVLCHWSNECQAELEKHVNPDQRKLLDRLQKTFRVSSADPDGKWAGFCELYDSFEFLDHVDAQPLAYYLERHYGNLLSYDWGIPRPTYDKCQPCIHPQTAGREFIMAKAIYVGGCRISTKIEDLAAELKAVLSHMNVNWVKWEADCATQVFPKSHAEGSYSSLMLPLATKVMFCNHPVDDELPTLALLTFQPPGKSANVYWVQPCPTQDIAQVQCGYVAFVLAGGGTDPLSAQVYHRAATTLIDQLSDDERSKLLVVSVPLSLAGAKRGTWRLRMSATVAYIREPGSQPRHFAADLRRKLFGERDHAVTSGVTLSVHDSFRDALQLQPNSLARTPVPVTIISGIVASAPLTEILKVCGDTGALQLAGNNLLVHAQSRGYTGQLNRHLIVTGPVSINPVSGTADVRYAGISYVRVASYAISITAHTELRGLINLREQHQLGAQTPRSAPGSKIALKAATNDTAAPATPRKIAWSSPATPTTLTVKSTQSADSQSSSQALARQDSRISALEASIAEIKSTALTKESMLDILKQWDQSKQDHPKQKNKNGTPAKPKA